ncbi:hypothetical protein ACSBR1_006140 [Camellia fascicularis]
MDIVPATYVENIKSYWKKRGYQLLDEGTHSKKGLSNKRLGSKTCRAWKISQKVPKLRLKIVSPIKLLAKFHDAYLYMIIRFVWDHYTFPNANKSTTVHIAKRKTITRTTPKKKPILVRYKPTHSTP